MFDIAKFSENKVSQPNTYFTIVKIITLILSYLKLALMRFTLYRCECNVWFSCPPFALIRMADFLTEVLSMYLHHFLLFLVKKTKHVLRLDWIAQSAYFQKYPSFKIEKRHIASDIEFNKSHGKFLIFCSTRLQQANDKWSSSEKKSRHTYDRKCIKCITCSSPRRCGGIIITTVLSPP